MASISFKDFLLNQTAITGKRKADVSVVDARTRYKINAETRQRTEEIEGYAVDIIAAHGRTQTVKLPVSAQDSVTKIIDALKDNMLVTVNFGEPSTLSGKCYAMFNNGQLISGVSASATKISIVNIEADEDYADDVIDM